MINPYQEHILEHYHEPHNFGHLPKPTHVDCALNPTCGDKICIELAIKDDIITDIAFSGEGCAISQASASLLTEDIKKKSVATLKKMTKDDILKLLELPLSPNRLKCALLALETAHKALNHNIKP